MTPYAIGALLVLSMLSWPRTRASSHKESVAVGVSLGLAIALAAAVPIAILH